MSKDMNEYNRLKTKLAEETLRSEQLQREVIATKKECEASLIRQQASQRQKNERVTVASYSQNRNAHIELEELRTLLGKKSIEAESSKQKVLRIQQEMKLLNVGTQSFSRNNNDSLSNKSNIEESRRPPASPSSLVSATRLTSNIYGYGDKNDSNNNNNNNNISKNDHFDNKINLNNNNNNKDNYSNNNRDNYSNNNRDNYSNNNYYSRDNNNNDSKDRQLNDANMKVEKLTARISIVEREKASLAEQLNKQINLKNENDGNESQNDKNSPLGDLIVS
jgi:hypothetical protein